MAFKSIQGFRAIQGFRSRLSFSSGKGFNFGGDFPPTTGITPGIDGNFIGFNQNAGDLDPKEFLDTGVDITRIGGEIDEADWAMNGDWSMNGDWFFEEFEKLVIGDGLPDVGDIVFTVGGISTVMTFNAGTYEASDSTALDVFNLLAQNIGQTLPFSIAESAGPVPITVTGIVQDFSNESPFTGFGLYTTAANPSGTWSGENFFDGSPIDFIAASLSGGGTCRNFLGNTTSGFTDLGDIEIIANGTTTKLEWDDFDSNYFLEDDNNTTGLYDYLSANVGNQVTLEIREAVQPVAGFTVGEGVPAGNVTSYGFLSQVVADIDALPAYGAIVPSEVEGIEIGSLILQRQASSTPSTFINLYDTGGVGFPDLGGPLNLELDGVSVQLTYRVSGRYVYSASGSAGDAIYNAFLNAVGTTVSYSLEQTGLTVEPNTLSADPTSSIYSQSPVTGSLNPPVLVGGNEIVEIKAEFREIFGVNRYAVSLRFASVQNDVVEATFNGQTYTFNVTDSFGGDGQLKIIDNQTLYNLLRDSQGTAISFDAELA